MLSGKINLFILENTNRNQSIHCCKRLRYVSTVKELQLLQLAILRSYYFTLACFSYICMKKFYLKL